MDILTLTPHSETLLFLIRVFVGITMIYFGYPKIKDLRSNARDFVGMGFKPGMFWGTLIALIETVGGALLILGILVPIVAVLFGIQMIVGTIWKITQTQKGFKGWSYDLLLLALMIVFLTFGAGSWTIM